MNILPYKLKTTNEQLTSRAGLLIVAQMMEQLELSESIDHYFPSPKSNRGIPASSYLETLILMQHEGSLIDPQPLSCFFHSTALGLAFDQAKS